MSVACHILPARWPHQLCGSRPHAPSRGRSPEKDTTVIGVDSQSKDAFNFYGGQLGHFNSQWQDEVLGVSKDTFDPWDFIDSYQLRSAGRAHPDLIRQFAWRNGELVD